MYTDGKFHGPDARCPTCGMTDAKFTSLVYRSYNSALVAWIAGVLLGIGAGLLFVWWTMQGVGSLLHLVVGLALLAKSYWLVTSDGKSEFITGMLNRTIYKDIRTPCREAQDAAADTLH
jgi:hypothetical protein